MFRPNLLVIVLVLFATFGYLPSAYADSQSVTYCTNCNGYTFQADLTSVSSTPGAYALSYTITNVSGNAASPYSWSLTPFDSKSTVLNFSDFKVSASNGNDYTGGFRILAGKSSNGNANCNGTISNGMCVQQSGFGSVPILGQGQSVNFTFDFTCSDCSELQNWIFLSQGNCRTGAGNCYAISAPGKPVSMPEPSNIALYAATFSAFGLFLLWTSRKRLANLWSRSPCT